MYKYDKKNDDTSNNNNNNTTTTTTNNNNNNINDDNVNDWIMLVFSWIINISVCHISCIVLYHVI